MKPFIEFEVKYSGNSYFKPENEKIYDLTRDNYKKIKLFGITIWQKTDVINNSQIVNIETNNKVGFAK